MIDCISGLTNDREKIIDYFKEIALGSEFGGSLEFINKWIKEMKIWVSGDIVSDLIEELNVIIEELNVLTEDSFNIRIVDEKGEANFHIFFGPGGKYAGIYPYEKKLVKTNWGLFTMFIGRKHHIVKGHMYVDTVRPNLTEQRHLLREELTQALGLAKDSNKYVSSIFQQAWTTVTSYSPIDRELIRLLYHPRVKPGMDAAEVTTALRTIHREENIFNIDFSPVYRI